MSFGQKLLALNGINLDLTEALMPVNQARFIKNLVYSLDDPATSSSERGGAVGVFKPLQSNALYIDDLVLPAGDNATIGAFSSKETKEVFVFVFNSEGNHTIYRLNGDDQTYNIVKQGACLNFQLSPEHFIAVGGSELILTYITDPATGITKIRSFLFYTDGFNAQGFIAVEDSIATNGFDPVLFPYFRSSYDPCTFIRMGVPTPYDCIKIDEVPRQEADESLNNRILFNTWQFRIRYYDVWGRPSEYGIISDMYIPGINDCLSASDNLSRCIDLTFNAPSPIIDKVEIAYRNCNDQQWYTSDVLNLYDGSPLGEWWKRLRNPKVIYNSNTNKITYRFCADKECNAVAPTDTNRLFNPMGRTSQALTQVGKFIGLSNNKYGFNPLSQSLRDKIKFIVDPPQAQVIQESRNITIYVPIWNEALSNYQQVTKTTDGFIWGDNNANHGGAVAYSQVFTNKSQNGFAGYLVNGNLSISTQVYLDGSGVLQDDPNFEGMDLSPTHFTMQKFVFNNVPKGVYVFRLSSTLADPNATANYRNTSTTVWGRCPFNPSNFGIATGQRELSQELIIDVCNADYNTLTDNKILVILDMAAFVGNQRYRAKSGYIHETILNGSPFSPMELMSVSNPVAVSCNITDHNGFYYFETRSPGRNFGFSFYYKCQLQEYDIQVGEGGMKFQDVIMDQLRAPSVNILLYPDFFTVPCNRILIKGRLVIQGTTIGIPSATVVITRGQTATTDADGNFVLIAHDMVRGGANRIDQLIITNGICAYSPVGGGCLIPETITIIHCTTCGVREVDAGTTILIGGVNLRGLLSGGTYAVGVSCFDWLGRCQFVQDLGYITIPSVQQTKAFAPSTVRVHIDPLAIFPDEFEYMTFWISAETTIDDYITWIVDSFEFIDNTGLVNNISPTQIKIFYSSLNEYNKQNNFNTTTNWQFLEPLPTGSTTQTAFLHDKVEFLANGDGTFFPKAITSLVKYDQTGQSFLINYTDDLKNLKQNAFIRLVRPKSCTGTEPEYEVGCTVVRLVNHAASVTDFMVNAFDTYYLHRQLPVPTLIPGSDPPAFINEPRIFGLPFEHNSPSDFWGQGCWNRGRVNVKNPYETVLFERNETALSGAVSITGQLNFLCFFDDARKAKFRDLNGITALLMETSIGLILGQSDHAIVGFDDNIGRFTSDGFLQAPATDDSFGKEQRKVGDNYGCFLFDKNTISQDQGIVEFLDSSNAVIIKHNFQNAVPISENGADGYVRAKVKDVQNYNLTHSSKRYFTGVINTLNKEYILTDFIINSNNFINQLRQYDVSVQETISFSGAGNFLKAWYSFTAEAYTCLKGEKNDQQLFSFKKGLPYRHYTTDPNTTFNTFFGVKCGRVFRIVMVVENLKKKKFLSFGVYCKQGVYFADEIKTETGQLSRTLIPQFVEAEYFWSAPFMCNLLTPTDSNSPNKIPLTDGDSLYGTWIDIRLIGDPAIDDQYSELQGVIGYVFPDEKSGVK